MTLGSGAVQSKRKIAADLTAIGVAGGDILLVHTSLRAVGPVEDGPRGLIDALLATLGPGGTLVMPSWTGDDATPFDAQTTRASSSLGIVPETFWRMDGVVRSAHAFAVAAHGPRAKAITAGELPIPPHAPDSPIGHLHDLDGKVLLLGVGHDANTSLHLAELIGGAPYRVPKHITILENGRPKRLDYGENDHCCQLFAQADGWLRDRG